jgi:predicted transcriptional regulator
MSQKKRGRPPKETEGVPKTTLHIEIPVTLKQRFKAVADAERRKLTAVVILALEDYIAKWQDQEEVQDDED